MGCSLNGGVAAHLVIEYVAGTLDDGTAGGFEAHLKTCASCRQLLAEQQSVWASLDAWHAIEPSPNFDQRLSERIAQEEQLPWWRRLAWLNLSWRPVLPVAAASALLLIAFFIKQPRFANSSVESTHEPRIEQQVQRALDDMEMLTQIGQDVAVSGDSLPSKI